MQKLNKLIAIIKVNKILLKNLLVAMDLILLSIYIIIFLLKEEYQPLKDITIVSLLKAIIE